VFVGSMAPGTKSQTTSHSTKRFLNERKGAHQACAVCWRCTSRARQPRSIPRAESMEVYHTGSGFNPWGSLRAAAELAPSGAPNSVPPASRSLSAPAQLCRWASKSEAYDVSIVR
jgi:hypothetical protein